VTDLILHPTPRLRDVVREQIRVVGLALRREAMVAAVVLGILTLVIATDIVRGNAATWFDSDEWAGVGVVSFLFPFAVWRGERRFGPAFLWTLPVDRRRLALTKVFAGWVWLITALAGFVFWHKALAVLSGVTGAQTTPLLSLTGGTAMYLLGSALVLGLRHPLRWLLGTAGVFFLLASLNEALGRTENGMSRMFAWSGVLRWAVYGPYGIETLLSSGRFSSAAGRAATAWRTHPRLASTAIIVLWIGTGVIALWAAASRHRERRRS
jgi:hypothetical protein